MKKTFIALVAVLAVSALPQSAKADLILGGQLYYGGGDVTIEVLEASAAYHSFLGLYGVGFLAENHDTGESITFNPSDFGYSAGDELVFGIAVYRRGTHDRPRGYLAYFLMGPAERNPDNFVHAGIEDLGDGYYIVGFEDLWRGGDEDYDDNRFLFHGGIYAVPEPGILLLLGAGLLGIGLRRRKKVKV